MNNFCFDIHYLQHYSRTDLTKQIKLFIWTYAYEWRRFTTYPRHIFGPTDGFGGFI